MTCSPLGDLRDQSNVTAIQRPTIWAFSFRQEPTCGWIPDLTEQIVLLWVPSYNTHLELFMLISVHLHNPVIPSWRAMWHVFIIVDTHNYKQIYKQPFHNEDGVTFSDSRVGSDCPRILNITWDVIGNCKWCGLTGLQKTPGKLKQRTLGKQCSCYKVMPETRAYMNSIGSVLPNDITLSCG